MSTSLPIAEESVRAVSGLSFIEVQFPVSKLSKESYDERKAVRSQTLTGLGKWWGRKPLALVRAIIIGLLLPATDNPQADREVFLALMTMDDDGMLRRMKSALPASVVYEICTPRERAEAFESGTAKPAWRRSLSIEARKSTMHRAFLRMSYDQRLEFCRRLEEVSGPSDAAWDRINQYLGTCASNLPELIGVLGSSRFGNTPRIGDVFSGGGSIPFEAARIGCDAYGSDLNPMAALLTLGALNIVGGGMEAVQCITAAQQETWNGVQSLVDDWGIERNEQGWIAESYLYCAEVLDPATDWYIPLAPSWTIADKTRVSAKLVPDHSHRRFDIQIVEDTEPAEYAQAAEEGTWQNGVRSPVDRDGDWLLSDRRQVTSFDRLRGSTGLRLWESDEIIPRPDDVFQERLYCIRWYDPLTRERHYRAPTESDFDRERRVLDLLRARFSEWQASGFIPRMAIEPGSDINRPTNARGWTHWHQLFNPRQLLLSGLFAECAAREGGLADVALLLTTCRLADWNSRLCRWIVPQSGGIGGGTQTFYSPSLPTPFVNYSCRPMRSLYSAMCLDISAVPLHGKSTICVHDARDVNWQADIWITDPGYGNLVSYEQLSEFFISWICTRLTSVIPGWYGDSKRALAVKGEGAEFRTVLAECYKRTAHLMSADGFQVVMFTHQNPSVWADLALVLWAAGLRVSAAWTIATETGSTGIRQGNYVQGTVILVLRKRRGDERGELSDIFPDVQAEVRRQVKTMLALDPKDDPNFGDADYQLAAYAAALRVITSYSAIGDIDVERELGRTQHKGETSPVTMLIERAVRIASDELVPAGLDATMWRKLGPEERLYLKGIAVEARGDSREGVYQELARGFGAGDFRQMLASRQANKVRLKTPSEFAAREMRTPLEGGFPGSLLRYVLFAVYTVTKDLEQGPQAARTYLRQEWPDYWNARATIIGLLRYLQVTPAALSHWDTEIRAVQLLLGSVENDSM